MNITSLIDIVGGQLKNSPSISSFYNIKLESKKVSEGDLFIAKKETDIKEAIKNGAFVIIFDFETKVLDKEIAWIKVENCKEALIKILRFKLSPLSINVFFCDSFTYELVNIYKNSLKSTFLLSSKDNSILNILNNINSIENIFSNDQELLSTIYPACKVLRKKEYKIKNLIKHSLFETSFSYKEVFYTKLKLPALYLNSYLNFTVKIK